MDDNTHKGSVSDHLANERTFLAWVRTSIALMGFGFVVVKFSLFVRQLSIAVTGHSFTPVTGFSGVIGFCLVGIGAVAALIGYLRYRQVEKHLLKADFRPHSTLLLILTVFVIAGSMLLLYYLLPNL